MAECRKHHKEFKFFEKEYEYYQKDSFQRENNVTVFRISYDDGSRLVFLKRACLIKLIESEIRMTELRLVSPASTSLKPVVEAALANELRLLQAGVQRTEERLHQFEAKFQISTADFLRQFENDELEETLELTEWVGEYRLLQKLREKVDILEGIHIAN